MPTSAGRMFSTTNRDTERSQPFGLHAAASVATRGSGRPHDAGSRLRRRSRSQWMPADHGCRAVRERRHAEPLHDAELNEATYGACQWWNTRARRSSKEHRSRRCLNGLRPEFDGRTLGLARIGSMTCGGQDIGGRRSANSSSGRKK